MGSTTSVLPLWIVTVNSISQSAQVDNDRRAVTNYVANGGCLQEFRAAMAKCDRSWDNDAVVCVGATKAQRECFARNPDYFEHQYIKRLDSGLDEDRGSSSRWEDVGKYRWWTGLRRS